MLLPIWELILLQIVIHQKIKVKDLCLLFNYEKYEFVNEQISNLVRMKLLISEDGILSINPFIYVFVIKHLRHKNLIA